MTINDNHLIDPPEARFECDNCGEQMWTPNEDQSCLCDDCAGKQCDDCATVADSLTGDGLCSLCQDIYDHHQRAESLSSAALRTAVLINTVLSRTL